MRVLLLSFFISINAMAEGACERNHIESFRVSGFSQFSDQQNICLSSHPAGNLIEQIGRLNASVAEFFGSSPEDFYERKIRVHFKASNKSSLGSSYDIDRKEIVLTAFPSWFGGDIDDATYLHEVGHWLTHNPLTRVPNFVREMKFRRLFREFFADYLAFAHYERISTNPGRLPNCMAQYRVPNEKYHFKAPWGEIDGYAFYRNTFACCEKNPSDMKAQKVCTALRGSYKENTGRTRLPPYNHRFFSPKDLGHINYDVHWFGHIIHSFLLETSREAGISLYQLLPKLFRQPGLSTRIRHNYNCRVRGEEYSIEVGRPSLRFLLNSIKTVFFGGKERTFERAWKKYSINRGLEIDREQMMKEVRGKATLKLLFYYRKNHPERNYTYKQISERLICL